MITLQTVSLIDFSDLSKPILFYLMMLSGIFYYAYKYKKIMNLHFVICVLLSSLLFLNLIMYFCISRKYVMIESFFFKDTLFFFSMEDITQILLILVVMLYFQWNVMGKFKAEWGNRERHIAKCTVNLVSMLMILIHVLVYLGIYFN